MKQAPRMLCLLAAAAVAFYAAPALALNRPAACKGRARPCPSAHLFIWAGTSPAPTVLAQRLRPPSTSSQTTRNLTARTAAAVQRAKGGRAAKDTKHARDAQARARQLAAAALLEAAEAARAVEHAVDRVSLEADAADALWSLDEATARSLLRRAWEFTTDPNALAAFRPEEEGARFGPRERILQARHLIITCAAKHDPKLAESYLQESHRGLPPEEGEEESDALASARRGARREPSALNARRIYLAHHLLNEGAFENAAALAAPAVADGPNQLLLRFIMRLRAFAPREADALYLRLVALTRADPAADAGDILLLSTPVVTPEVFVLVEPDGSTVMAPAGRYENDPPGAAHLSARARRAFFDAAAAVLLRAAPDGAANEALATFFAVGRLFPFFERESPQHVAALRARQTGLAQEISEARRAAVSAQMHVERLTPRNPPDPLHTNLSELERATNDAERDAARFNAASAAAFRKLWERARQFAGEIGDARTRRAAFLLIAAEQVKHVGEGFRDEDEPDDFERAAAFARAADVPAAVRASGLAQAAELAARKGKRKRAGELFDEALTAAAAVDKGTAVQVALLTLLTNAASRTDAVRAWELAAELVAAVNEHAGRPESVEAVDECAGVWVETSQNAYCVELAEPVPEIWDVFGTMARLDLERALREARTLKGPYTRASSLIHAARAAVPPAARRGAQAR